MGLPKLRLGAYQMEQLMVTFFFFFQDRLSIMNGQAIADQMSPISPNDVVDFRMG